MGHLSQLRLTQESRACLQNGFGLNLEVIVAETRRDDGDSNCLELGRNCRAVRFNGVARPRLSEAKKKAILVRIESLEQAARKAREYLEAGKHANWIGFQPIFVSKGLPPHKDWVRNVFLARTEKALRRAERLLERFD